MDYASRQYLGRLKTYLFSFFLIEFDGFKNNYFTIDLKIEWTLTCFTWCELILSFQKLFLIGLLCQQWAEGEKKYINLIIYFVTSPSKHSFYPSSLPYGYFQVIILHPAPSVIYLSNLAGCSEGSCCRACPIDRLLWNSRTSVQSPSVKATPTTGLGGRLPSRDTAPFLHRSIKSLQPEKAAALRHLLDHNSPRKPLGATLKARKAVFLSVFFSPGGGECWAGKKINKWMNITHKKDPFFLSSVACVSYFHNIYWLLLARGMLSSKEWGVAVRRSEAHCVKMQFIMCCFVCVIKSKR